MQTGNHRISILAAVLVISACSDASAQLQGDVSAEKAVKPFRVAVKAGSPNLLGLELEGIVPGIGGWLGIWAGFTYLPLGGSSQTTNGVETESSSGGLKHLGIGTNLYPNGRASGVFASLGYDRVALFENYSGSGKPDLSNPTQMFSTQLGYKYVGRIFTFSFTGGYGFNFGYQAPEVEVDAGGDDGLLFRKGNWILTTGSFGVAFPFTKRKRR